VQGQRADPEQKDIEDRSAGHVNHEIKYLALSDGKTTTLRPRRVGAMRRADSAGMAWLKRMWDHLTRRRQFSVAFLDFRGSRR
jgi:hypothetical protein